jgi:hypothetical protein
MTSTRRTPLLSTSPSGASRPPLACRLRLHHTWKTFSTEDGNRYQACGRCLRERPDLLPVGAIYFM